MRTGRVSSVFLFVCLWALPVAASEKDATTSTSELALKALKAQLAAQQKQIQQLQELLSQQGELLGALQRQLVGEKIRTGQVHNHSANSVTVLQPPASASEQAVALERRVSELEQTVAERQKTNKTKWKALGNFSFSGDLRVRYEPFFQSGVPQRHRERARLRFQARASITKELSGGFRFATGALDNPNTANQSFTGFFTRKAFSLDRFWLTYKPERAPWFEFTAGKFTYPWYRTELTFDNDLNPEGFSETLSFDFHDAPLANLKLVGFQLPFNELSSAGDSFLWGGQVQTHWKLAERTRLGLHATGINFRNADAVARAIGTGTLQPSLPLTNSVRVDAVGNIIGYSSRFAYLDLIAQLDHQFTPRWPLRLTLDFVNNVRARNGERSGYWAEVTLGQTREKGGWLFGYTLIRIEKDAVIGAYNLDELRASTNLLNHRLRSSYQAHNHVRLDYTLYLGRLFNPQDNLNLVPLAFQPSSRDPLLRRMQFDVIYQF